MLDVLNFKFVFQIDFIIAYSGTESNHSELMMKKILITAVCLYFGK